MELLRGLSSPLALLLVLALNGCQSSPPDRGKPKDPAGATSPKRPVIGFGLILETDPGVTYKAYQPLMDHLTAHAPFLFQLRPGKTSDDLLRSVEERMASSLH